MKHLRQIIILTFVSIANMQNLFAQFNTVGRDFPINSSRKIGKNIGDTIAMKTQSSFCLNPIKEREKNRVERPLVCLPLKRIFITSPFGYRIHPVSGKYKLHNGIDLRASFEEVYSMLPGKVHKVGVDNVSGKYVIIATGNYLISYCHLSEIRVGKECIVSAGEIIGVTGQSGMVSGPHLHLTLRLYNKYIDPKNLINALNKFK